MVLPWGSHLSRTPFPWIYGAPMGFPSFPDPLSMEMEPPWGSHHSWILFHGFLGSPWGSLHSQDPLSMDLWCFHGVPAFPDPFSMDFWECPQCHLVDGDDGHGDGHHQHQRDPESCREKQERSRDLARWRELSGMGFPWGILGWRVGNGRMAPS